MADPKPKTIAITYVGFTDEVFVPDADVFCKHGETIEVDADLARSLLRQVDSWQPAKSEPKPPAKSKPKPPAT